MWNAIHKFANWVLDKWGAVLISWLWNNPGKGSTVLAALLGGVTWIYYGWQKLAWIDRLVVATLATLCLGTLTVFLKWLIGTFRSTSPIPDVPTPEEPAKQLSANVLRSIHVFFIGAIVVALFWPSNLAPTPDTAQPVDTAKAPLAQGGNANNPPVQTVLPGGVGSVGQQGGITAAQVNIGTEVDPRPTVPNVSISTIDGLSTSDFPDRTISAEMTTYLRRHRIVVSNYNTVNLSDIVIRFQLPEPVTGGIVIEDEPPGVAVRWYACRISFTLTGAGASAAETATGGTVIATGTSAGSSATMVGDSEVCSAAMTGEQLRPTGIYQLGIDMLPASTSIRLAMLTSNGPEGSTYRELAAGDNADANTLVYFGGICLPA